MQLRVFLGSGRRAQEACGGQQGDVCTVEGYMSRLLTGALTCAYHRGCVSCVSVMRLQFVRADEALGRTWMTLSNASSIDSLLASCHLYCCMDLASESRCEGMDSRRPAHLVQKVLRTNDLLEGRISPQPQASVTA